MFDLKITGGLVVDGTGVAPQIGDIGIVGDRIVAVVFVKYIPCSRSRVRHSW